KDAPRDMIVQSIVLPTIHAKLNLDGGYPKEALKLLDAARAYEFGDSLNGCAYSAYLRGQAFLIAEDPYSSAEEFRRILNYRGVGLFCPTGVLAHLGLARALAAQASKDRSSSAVREEARTAYQDFLSLWKDADAATPILRAAKTEYAQLLTHH